MIRIRMLAAALLATTVVAGAVSTPAQAGARKRMIRTINYVRSWKHRRPLTFSSSLSRGAAAWARHLMQASTIGHAAIPTGEGEIIEWHTGGSPAVDSTVMEWWHSTEHRRIMMLGGFRRVGAGRATGYYGGRKCTIWVVRFS